MVSLDQVGALLANHIDGVLDAAVGDDWDNRSIDDPEILNPVDVELRVTHTLFNAGTDGRYRKGGPEQPSSSLRREAFPKDIRRQRHP